MNIAVRKNVDIVYLQPLMQNERAKISEESFQKTFVIFSIFIHEKSLGACLSVKLSVKLA